MHALLLESVSKRYASHAAVRDLSLAVPAGSIYGILGPNGAGKSTTLRMVMNLIACDTGRIRVLGEPPAARRNLRHVGYLPEERGLYRRMGVLDVIVFFGRLKGMSAATARREARDWLERLGLEQWSGARVSALSKGMQQKVQFITTVLHNPSLLILDEPHAGLDPVNQEVLRETILRTRDEGRTVVLSTHNMDEAESLCDAVCIIAAGEKVLDGTVRDIRRRQRGQHFRLHIDPIAPAGALDDLAAILHGLSSRTRPSADRSVWDLHLEEVRPQEVLARIAGLPLELDSFERVAPTLHDIFMERVGARPMRTPPDRDDA